MAVKYFVVLRAYDVVQAKSYDALESGPFDSQSEAEALREQFSAHARTINGPEQQTRYTAILTQKEV